MQGIYTKAANICLISLIYIEWYASVYIFTRKGLLTVLPNSKSTQLTLQSTWYEVYYQSKRHSFESHLQELKTNKQNLRRYIGLLLKPSMSINFVFYILGFCTFFKFILILMLKYTIK